MDSLILLPLPDGRWLGLTHDELTTALARGAELMGSAFPSPTASAIATTDELYTAEQMAARTSVKASWYLEQARLKQIPYVRFGKYVRFNPRAVEQHQSRSPDTRTTDPRTPRKLLNGKAL